MADQTTSAKPAVKKRVRKGVTRGVAHIKATDSAAAAEGKIEIGDRKALQDAHDGGHRERRDGHQDVRGSQTGGRRSCEGGCRRVHGRSPFTVILPTMP